jgi:hypothetical protein
MTARLTWKHNPKQGWLIKSVNRCEGVCMEWYGRVAKGGCFPHTFCSFSYTETYINCQKFQKCLYEDCDILKLLNLL